MLVASPSPIRQKTRRAETCCEHAMALIPTAWGVCGVAWTDPDACDHGFAVKPEGALLCRIIPPGLSEHELRAELLAAYPNCREVFADDHGRFHPEVAPEWLPDLIHFLQRYYSADMHGPSLPEFEESWAFWRPRLDWSQLTAFQRQVLEHVAGIPCGMKRTYGDVARQCGKPAASRAVGAAVGSNPWPVLVPCHRVVGSTGKLTGFSAPGGVEAKRRMLEMEQR